MKHLTSIFAVFALMGIGSSAYAHHSNSAFDMTAEINLEGVVTSWAFVNPHAYLYFDVTDDNGKVVNWRCEASAATAQARSGYTKSTFIPGQHIGVIAHPARHEQNDCTVESFIFDDGTIVGRTEQLPADKVVGTLPTVIDQGERSEFLPNGQPNISGYWVTAGRGGPPGGAPDGAGRGAGGPDAGGPGAAGRGAGGPPRGPQLDLTEAGKAKLAKYEQVYDDPSIQCDISSIFFGWTHDGHTNEIKQEDDRIILTYGYMDAVRTIYLTDKHPANIVPSRVGNSIGHWEDKTLVVDTIGFTPGILIPIVGYPNSDQMHSVEKFWYDPETKMLNRSYVAEDSVYLASPYTGADTMLLSTHAYEPYNCVDLSGDANKRPEDQTGEAVTPGRI